MYIVTYFRDSTQGTEFIASETFTNRSAARVAITNWKQLASNHRARLEATK